MNDHILTTKISALRSLGMNALGEVNPGAITSAPLIICLMAPVSTLTDGNMLGSIKIKNH
jgi:hypothetical protein